jgi:multicomponent Na+:H+ antiporter subunit G
VSWLTIISDALLVVGVLFALTGGVGLHRLPEFYTRTHAASVTDSAGAAFVLVALLLRSEELGVSVRLLLILLFLLFTSPTATHALAQAALQDGHSPLPGARERSK